MGALFLTYLGEFEAKQASVIPRGTKMVQVMSSAASPESVSTPELLLESSSSSESSLSSVAAKLPSSPKAQKPAPIAATLLKPAAPESSSSAISEPKPVSSSSPSVASEAASTSDFPAFDHTSFPVSRTPNWGAMRTPQEWNRSHAEMTAADFVSLPRYDMSTLTIPMSELTNPIRDENIPIITAKLFYSTRYLGSYDLDAGEHTGGHAGIDLKLARGTPIGAIAGGRVSSVATTETLGLHVVIEHRLRNGETYYSVYGHFDSTSVSVGQEVKPGQQIGNVGMTGNTSAPHLHLQVDRGIAGGHHIPFVEGGDAALDMVHPISFITKYRNGEQ